MNWEEERKQDIALGKRCRTCGKHYPKICNPGGNLYPGHPVNCQSCDGIYSSGEMSHHKFIRCPKCHATQDALEEMSEANLVRVWCGDPIVFACQSCDCDFEVRTRCEITFTSPALDAEQTIDEDDD